MSRLTLDGVVTHIEAAPFVATGRGARSKAPMLTLSFTGESGELTSLTISLESPELAEALATLVNTLYRHLRPSGGT